MDQLAEGPSHQGDRDPQLIERIVRGDTRALARLYDRHAPAMLATGLRILGDSRDAEDLVHDVFIEAWESARRYDPVRGSARAWLLTRVRSRAIDRLRSRAAAQRATAVRGDLRVARPASEADPSVRAECERACRALAGLTALQREVLDLAYFEGFSSREIAEHCGIPVGTAKSRLAAALASLRRAFAVGEEIP